MIDPAARGSETRFGTRPGATQRRAGPRRRRRRGGWLVAPAIVVATVLAACGPDDQLGDVEAVTQAESPTVEAEAVHPDFSFTLDELVALMGTARGADTEALQDRPEYFLELVAAALRTPIELLQLVDKEHPLPEDYVPDDLVAATDFPLVVNRSDMLLRAPIMPDLVAMSTAARLDGVVLDLSSGYRSYDYQAGLFERHVADLGLEEARRVSAEPGRSQHQLGTTIDFGSITPAFADTAAGRWLAEHAWRFGFSLSYPDGFEELTGYMYESWHFRYLGRKATTLEREFFGGIQQYMLEFLAENRVTLSRAFTGGGQG